MALSLVPAVWKAVGLLPANVNRNHLMPPSLSSG